MAKYDFDLSEPKGEWSKDEIAFYQAIHNVKLMKDYINKDSKLKREWFATYNIGQDNATLIVESNYVGVRLFFEFINTGFVYVSTRDISGATYNNRNIGGWNYSKTDDWNGYFEMIVDILKNYFEKFNESKKSAKKSIKEAKTVTCISCEKNLNDYRNDPMCTQTWDYADGDSKWYQKSIHECIEDAKKFIKKGYLCYIDGELFDEPDVFDDESYFKMEIKPKSSAKKSIKESKIIKCVDLGYDPHTGKDYYTIVRDLRNGNLYYIKNAGCNANAYRYCCEINGLEYEEDIVTLCYFEIIYSNECAKGVPHIVDIDRVNKKYKKYIKDVILENKFTEKSLKEYRTVGLEQEVRDKCIEILEDSHSDLFELGYSDAIITYDNDGRAETTSSGDVWIDYITLPLYSWSSGSFPSNKKAEKIFNNIIDTNMEMARERLWDKYEDELVELGITDKNDDKLNYNDLYDMNRGDLAEELSEYEMDMEGTELYTQVSCDITKVDYGIELEVSMLIADEYGHALVKDYKSKSVIITEDTKDIEDVILDCIRSVTENW